MFRQSDYSAIRPYLLSLLLLPLFLSPFPLFLLPLLHPSPPPSSLILFLLFPFPLSASDSDILGTTSDNLRQGVASFGAEGEGEEGGGGRWWWGFGLSGATTTSSSPSLATAEDEPGAEGKVSGFRSSTWVGCCCCQCWNTTGDEVAAGGVEGEGGGDNVEESTSETVVPSGLEAMEVECRCAGEALRALPKDLDPTVRTLTIAETGLEVLERDSFKPYRDSLRDVSHLQEDPKTFNIQLRNTEKAFIEAIVYNVFYVQQHFRVLMEMTKLKVIESGIFRRLRHLRTIYISQAPELKTLSPGIFHGISSNLYTLRIVHTGLEEVPDLRELGSGIIMQMIDMENNGIKEVKMNAVRVKAEQLLLNYNAIESVEGWAFNGSEIAKLSLKGNRLLTKLSPDAFLGLKSLREIDLSMTSITQLPTAGLEELDVLRLEDTTSLKVIPSVYSFKHLREAWLTYSFHCCAFKFPARHNPKRHALHQAYLEQMRENCNETEWVAKKDEEWGVEDEDRGLKRKRRRRSFWGEEWEEPPLAKSPGAAEDPSWGGRWLFETISTKHDIPRPTSIPDDPYDPYQHEKGKAFGPPFPNSEFGVREGMAPGWGLNGTTWAVVPALPGGGLISVGDDGRGSDGGGDDGGFFHQTTATLPPKQLEALCGNLFHRKEAVQCHPAPDAFNPCEDIMGRVWLRAAVWAVVVTSVAGNLAVLLVLLSARFRMSVSKFLMCNLAVADLCMGLYLLLIATMDARTIGVYFNFAFDWQYGSGCKVAGFITVFASQLSIFTLSILTLERWFAITYAMYLNKRLKLPAAAKVMAGGWIYALTMASLPLLGISGYSTTSICLPMETADPADVVYLSALLIANCLAFFLICACYARIYFSLDKETRRGGNSVTSAPVGLGMGSGRGRGRSSASRASGEMTVAKRMALLVFTDFACWAPIAFFGLTAVAGMPLIDVTRSKILLVFFYPLNSCANPYLYAILTKQYRRDLFILLSRYGLCKRTAQRYKLAAGFFDDPAAVGSGSGRRRTGPRSAGASFDAEDVDPAQVASYSSVRNHPYDASTAAAMTAAAASGDFLTTNSSYQVTVPLEVRSTAMGVRAVSLPAAILENGVGCGGGKMDVEWRSTDAGECSEDGGLGKYRNQEVYL